MGLFIAMPMLLTVFHEAGHYYAAKLCGIDCLAFTLGVGPAIVRVPISRTPHTTPRPSSPCKLVLRALPIGGSVTYDDRYWALSHSKRALLSAAGWMADVLVASAVIPIACLIGVTSPTAAVICGLVAMRAACSLLPITSDGRSTLAHLWRAARSKALAPA